MINPSTWFEIPALDIDRAKTFYENVFAFDMTPENNAGYEMLCFPMEKGGIGATGALIKGFGYKPSLEGTMVYLDVDNIDDLENKIVNAGGKIHVHKKDIGEYGFISIFEDCEGNRLGLFQKNKNILNK